ncbi:MAG: electron transfer flavoprotein subunit alpha/FixB family protein [Deltaproteobacteria bacterium]|nr:electron transfer flavoprotein subunit alpha/FixB family protein [Deltaproteobacteria bacterium]
MAIHFILVEHQGGKLLKATLAAVAAANKIGGTTHALVLGKGAADVANEIAPYVQHVGVAEGAGDRLAQPWAKIVADGAKMTGATHVWAAATGSGKDILPRVAARLGAGMASDISAVVDEKTFKRPMWAGNVTGTVEITTAIKVISVRPTEFTPPTPGAPGAIVTVSVDGGESKMTWVKFDAVLSDRPALADARVVVSGGRGLKGPEGFKTIVEPLADVLGAAIGASRAVCDAGWVPNDWQVGQTGKVVAPELYIAVGISGAIQHVAGMKGSKCIVAINKEPEAPIFQIADYGLVADLFKVVPELTAAIKAAKS